MTMTDAQIEWATTIFSDYGQRILWALVILIVGIWFARLIRRYLGKAMERRGVDQTLIGFISSLLYYIVVVAVVISAISKLGIETTSFIAVLGAAGLAVGLALQGSLSNFASGVLLILFRPFKVGDFVEAGGMMGSVDDIGMLMTRMHTPDNKSILVPNTQVMGGHIVNFSAHDTRRLDLTFGISYGDRIELAKQVLEEIIEADERCLKDPAPTIGVIELADSSVNIVCRPWVNASDYWPLRFDLMERVKNRFDEVGISIPFPQRELHVYNKDTAPDA
jgi:small conductance mechanosensitive channel